MRDEEEDGIVREETSILKEGTKGGGEFEGQEEQIEIWKKKEKKGKEDRQKVGPLDDEWQILMSQCIHHPSFDFTVWKYFIPLWAVCTVRISGADKPGNTFPSMHCSTWAFKHHFNQCLRSVQRNKIVAVNSIYWVLLSTSLLLTACPSFFFQLCIFPFFFYLHMDLSFFYLFSHAVPRRIESVTGSWGVTELLGVNWKWTRLRRTPKCEVKCDA